eukprot:CAMPEP_0202082242 /NCGR_PEP_ID=MMETSP0964-20121228/18360_1 /ASSEMBLY_ACC=CAM_ASM_000500 /TAXON_ID=4773 /ORGANISM="Schizochytrium aggregatum, Strain ATCC28209" /LENGTH=77 /DNA_ID=CAMNT_0048649865 /DNA_START=50 /DNA_END=279 /DNA_ORIENTATION=-
MGATVSLRAEPQFCPIDVHLRRYVRAGRPSLAALPAPTREQRASRLVRAAAAPCWCGAPVAAAAPAASPARASGSAA